MASKYLSTKSQSKPIPRWSKKRIREQFSWTNKCFYKALLDVYGDILSNEEKKGTTVDVSRVILGKGKEIHCQQTSEAYLSHLRKLTTEKIELIIDANVKGKQHRNPLTIDVLMSELLERSAISETRKKHGKAK